MTSRPPRLYLYRFTDAAGDLLYVGITQHRWRRLSAHLRRQPWADEVAAIAWEPVDTLDELLAREVEAIRSERPRYNVRDTARPRPPAAKAPAVAIHYRHPLTNRQRAMLALLADGPLTVDDLAAAFDTSPMGARATARGLVYRGLVDMTGGGDRSGIPHTFALREDARPRT